MKMNGMYPKHDAFKTLRQKRETAYNASSLVCISYLPSQQKWSPENILRDNLVTTGSK